MKREDYDDKIVAAELRPGDELHLTFMGGDEYVEIDKVYVTGNAMIHWEAKSWSDLEDEVEPDTEMWIKKKRDKNEKQ